jgi:hypothetical protein
MEFIRDFLEAWADRIRSPILGAFLISLVIVNWYAFYFLAFAETSASVRINYFKTNTDLASLTWIPALSALILLLVSPWLKWLGAWWARMPRKWLKEMEKDEAILQQIYELRKKTGLEKERAKFLSEQGRTEEEKGKLQAIIDRNLLDQTKRGKEAEEIGDEELANAIVEKRNREMAVPSDAQRMTDKLTALEREIVVLLGSNDILSSSDEVSAALLVSDPNIDRLFENFSERRLKVNVSDAVDLLRANKVVQQGDHKSGGVYYIALSSLGYKVLDIMVKSEAKPV